MKKIAIVVLICMLALIVIVSITIHLGIFPKNPNQSQNKFTFNNEYTASPWQLLWEKQNLYLGGSIPWQRNQFVATMNTLCYVAPEEDGFFHQKSLICVDIHDGKQKWIGQKADASSIIENDEKQVYIGGSTNRISAYNAENGQEIWRKRVDARNIVRVVAYDGFVSVEASPDSFSIFDASNGSHESSYSVPRGPSSFANDGNVRFDYGRSYIKAYDIQDNSLIWNVSFEDTVVYRPVFSNGLIIIRSGRYPGTLHVIDSKTGKGLWEKKGIASDFGINDTILFLVTTQGEILAIDVKTGDIQGRLVLDGTEFNAQKNEFSNSPAFFVRVVDDIVIVYLGDTGQLFSFQYSND